MHLVADGVSIVACRRYQEIQRLHSRVAGALQHYVEELPVGLGVQLIEDDAVGVEAVLVGDVRRKHLIRGVRRLIHELLLRLQNLHPFGERRTELYHIDRHVKDDLRLIAVRRAAVDLGAFLAVAAGEQKGYRRGKLTLSLFFRDLHVGGIELPVAVLLQNAEKIAHDPLLPVDELERFPGPCAFCVAERLDEHDRVVRRLLVVVRGLRHEPRRGVLLQLSQNCLLSGQQKSRPSKRPSDVSVREEEPFGSSSRWLS